MGRGLIQEIPTQKVPIDPEFRETWSDSSRSTFIRPVLGCGDAAHSQDGVSEDSRCSSFSLTCRFTQPAGLTLNLSICLG